MHLVFTREADVAREVHAFVTGLEVAWQSQTSTQSSDRGTVEPNVSGALGPGTIRLRPGGPLTAKNITLSELIEYAYQRHAFDEREVAGGPEWASVERFDLVVPLPQELAVSPDGAMNATWSAVREVLANRFALEVHEEARQRPIYALRKAATPAPGPQLRKTDIDCGAAMKESRPPVGPNGPACGMKTPPGRLFANTISMPTLASLLSRHVDRPVVDRTGLDGRFDVALEAEDIVAAPNYQPGPSDLALPPASGPSIFVAVREQLGLTLEPEIGRISVVVVDRAAKPSVR